MASRGAAHEAHGDREHGRVEDPAAMRAGLFCQLANRNSVGARLWKLGKRMSPPS
ncbi:hypothetical protein [Sphingomonas aracearum]|uniref:hypothetical protein n=1 Tax=Sphingomonas aracearum TaxID=2283317 RepID=UPI0015F0AB83|nr:hypothetical protein [Sphingomonas aracearum]